MHWVRFLMGARMVDPVDSGASRDEKRAGSSAGLTLVSRSFVLSKLRSRLQANEHDRYSPNDEPQRDYRRGHYDARRDEADFLRSFIAELDTARTLQGLREFRDAITNLSPGVLFEGVTILEGGE
jgi:hypothetical protein